MSWHHEDWLSFAQAVASTCAVAGAFGVVFLQNHLEASRNQKAERKNLVRERYRSAAYVEALIGNAIRALSEIVSAAEVMQRSGIEIFGNYRLHESTLDLAANQLGSALDRSLPTEIMSEALNSWTACSTAVRIVRHTAESTQLSVVETIKSLVAEYQRLQAAALKVQSSRLKWGKELAIDD